VNYYRIVQAHFEKPDTPVQALLDAARKHAGELVSFDELELGVLINQGEFEQVHAKAKQYRRQRPGVYEFEYRLAQARAGLGDLAGARILFGKLSRNINPASRDYSAAGIEACADDEDALFKHANRAIDVRAPHIIWFGLPLFAPKFVGPRGVALYERLRRSPLPPHRPIDL
jgi:hypothetical protein